MKVAPAAAAIPILLLTLSWLAFRSVDPEQERYDRALKALDRFTVTEISLHRDVLTARDGMLRNYDPLVREINALRDALGRLRDNASGDAEEAAAVDRFAAAAARQEELTEQFKSDNALLQNSLAYFGLLRARLSTSYESGPLAPGVSALTAAMLRLTLDTSPAAAHEVADRLSGLATKGSVSLLRPSRAISSPRIRPACTACSHPRALSGMSSVPCSRLALCFASCFVMEDIRPSITNDGRHSTIGESRGI